MRILLADDDEDTRQSCQELLEVEGHEVCSARDGQQAVDLAKTFMPDLAMLDIKMRRLTGFEAAAQIRAAIPGVTLVAVTSWPREGAQAQAAVFDHYLLKPANPADVCRLVHPARAQPNGSRPGTRDMEKASLTPQAREAFSQSLLRH